MSRASRARGQADSRMPVAGTILVGDDDPDLLRAVEDTLRSRGNEVVTARSGEEALRLARKHLPSLLILDARLPGLSGYEVCRRLRSDWRFVERAIIMLTSESLRGQPALGVAAGADEFVLKPFDLRELAIRVGLALRRVLEMPSSSPLTGLPGNVHIQQEIQLKVTNGLEVALLYVDVDHFKPYNDHYGFLRGDEAIRCLADVLRQAVDVRPGAFLGHVGGDDFVVLARPDEAGGIAREVIAGFEAEVSRLYDPQAAARGWIEVRDRRGRWRRYGLLTLSIGVATNRGHAVEDYRRLVDVATEMKQFAKSRAGNAVAVDRRDGTTVGVQVKHPAGGSTAHVHVSSRSSLNATRATSASTPRSVLIESDQRRNNDRAGARRSMRRRLAYAAAALVSMLVLAAGPVTFALAENARPGDVLWPVKLGVERVRLLLERSPAQDVALHLEFASRRVEDLQLLLDDHHRASLILPVSEDLTGHTDAVARGLSRLGSDSLAAATLAAQAQMVLRHNVEVLRSLVATACSGTADLTGPPGAACAGLQRALESSTGGLQASFVSAGGGAQPGGRPGEVPSGRDDGPPGGRGHEGRGGPASDRETGRERDRGKGARPPGQQEEKQPPAKAKEAGREPPAPEKGGQPPPPEKGDQPPTSGNEPQNGGDGGGDGGRTPPPTGPPGGSGSSS